MNEWLRLINCVVKWASVHDQYGIYRATVWQEKEGNEIPCYMEEANGGFPAKGSVL